MNNRNGVIVQFDVMTDLKLECPMRNKQGNCCPVGGFCADAVPDEICKAVRSAYERGYSDAVANENQKAMQPVRSYEKYQDYLHHCPTCERTLPVRSQYGKVNYCHYCGQRIVFK